MNEKRRPQGRENTPRRADRFAQRPDVEEVEGQLEGRNAITEALKNGRAIDKVFVADGDTDRGLQRLAAQAKEAGAVEYMKVARVTNINNAIAELKEKGVWIYGTAAEGAIPMY